MTTDTMRTTVSDSFFQRFCPDPCATFDLGELYAEFNAKYFDGKLPLRPVRTKIDENGETRNRYPTLMWNKRFKKVWGTYSANGKGTGDIMISRKAAWDPTQVRSTLLHEMVHSYLDLKGKDDGIKGHGPNFILEAMRINAKCEQLGVKYRVNFYNEPITQAEPKAECELLKTTIYCGKDLDVARKMRSVLNAAFDTKYEYQL